MRTECADPKVGARRHRLAPQAALFQHAPPEGGKAEPIRWRAADRDASLVDLLRRHAPGSAEALVAAYGDRVYRLAVRITGNTSDAEEVVQDVLWAIIRKIESFRGMAAFSSWVYRITARAAYQKRPGRRREISWEDLDFHAGPARPEEAEPDWSPRLADPALQAELHSVLCAAIDRLPAQSRAVLVMRDVEGLSNPEVADALQVPLATIKSRVHRARLFVRSQLSAYLDPAREPA